MCEQTLGQRKSVRLCYFLRIKKSSLLGIHIRRASAAKRQLSKPRQRQTHETNCCAAPGGGPQVTRYQTFGGNLRAHFAAAVRINSEKCLSPTHTHTIYAKTLTLWFPSLDGLVLSQIWLVFQLTNWHK